MVLNQENVKIIWWPRKTNKKNIVVLILLSEIKKLKTVSLPVHITQKKKKTSACLVLNKKKNLTSDEEECRVFIQGVYHNIF